MSHLCSIGIVVGLVFLYPTTAHAQWTTDLFLGKAWTQKNELKIEQTAKANALTFHQVEYQDRSFNFPLYYGFRVGHRLRRPSFLSVEFEFIHDKVYTDAGQRIRVSGRRGGQPIDRTMILGDIVQRFSISHGVNIFTLNLVGHPGLGSYPPLPNDRFRLAGRLGIGLALIHPESTIDGNSQEQYQWGGPALLLGIGLRTRIWRLLDLLLEYKLTSVRVDGADIDSGTACTHLWTHHLVGGTGYSW
jgi:hypothetical protein